MKNKMTIRKKQRNLNLIQQKICLLYTSLALALSKDSILNCEHYEPDKNGNKTNVTTHAEWLMSWNIPDVKTMAVLDYNNGHIPVTINDNNTGSSQTLYSGTEMCIRDRQKGNIGLRRHDRKVFSYKIL